MPRRIGFSTYQENFQGGSITDEEWEFMKAIAAYQKRFRRRYPTWTEVLHVARCLGYRKVARAVDIGHPAVDSSDESEESTEARNPTSEIRTGSDPAPAPSPRPDAGST